ncbi:hypothetical protein SY111_15780 [Ligilactobacillus agilis]|uniref:Uncharacterized protein n=1 Tax=Ligilactobacillus agilis TaxID=1601 RepID=A0A6F9XUI5_9LACO|nr:hypothetical protein [Ligilactobacillus agilis]GET08954.1 hypothetical protein SY111_15780 [Ligilactobacillus agilis]
MNETVEVLIDVDSGNGNRGILSKPRDFLSPVSFRVNYAIANYEDKISQLRVKEKNDQSAADKLFPRYTYIPDGNMCVFRCNKKWNCSWIRKRSIFRSDKRKSSGS